MSRWREGTENRPTRGGTAVGLRLDWQLDHESGGAAGAVSDQIVVLVPSAGISLCLQTGAGNRVPPPGPDDAKIVFEKSIFPKASMTGRGALRGQLERVQVDGRMAVRRWPVRPGLCGRKGTASVRAESKMCCRVRASSIQAIVNRAFTSVLAVQPSVSLAADNGKKTVQLFSGNR